MSTPVTPKTGKQFYIILFCHFNSFTWLAGLIEVVFTCFRQPIWIKSSKILLNGYQWYCTVFYMVRAGKSSKKLDQMKAENDQV